MSNFRDELRKEFTSKSLTDEQLNSLEALQEKKQRRKMSFPLWVPMVAASLVLAVFLFRPTSPLSQQVASEVSYNHLKNSPVELNTTSYKKAAAFLSKLDFSIRNSDKLSEYKLVGARYCSVKGKIAAQLKLVDSRGEILTLYQFKPESLLSEQSVKVDSTNVKIWSEGNIQFALAK